MLRFALLCLLSFNVYAADEMLWQRLVFSGGIHPMLGFVPAELAEVDILNVFIEGDGQPGVALELAKGFATDSVYLARPCQYLITTRLNTCSRELWTTHRYSETVVASMDRAITAMKLRYGARQVRLIGFSGGGTVASLIASKRGDVALLVTIAGNLDHKEWTDFNQSTPLEGSLNPIDFSQQLEHIEQVHLVGALDEVVPQRVLRSYLSKMTRLDRVTRVVVEDADHTCCWQVALHAVLAR